MAIINPPPIRTPITGTLELDPRWQTWFSQTFDTFKNGLELQGPLIVDGTLSVAGAAALTNTLTVSGAAALNGGLTASSLVVTGASSVKALGINGALTISQAGQSSLDLIDTVTGGTPAAGAHWRVFADNVGGGGGNSTLGFYDVNAGAVRLGIDNSGNIVLPTAAALKSGSDWQAWTPTYSCSGAMTFTLASTVDAQWFRLGAFVFFKMQVNFTLGGTASNAVYASLPVAGVGNLDACTCHIINGGTAPWIAGFGYVDIPNNRINVQVFPSSSSWSLGGAWFMVSGFYRVA